MTWQSLSMTADCEYFYAKVRKFTLVKETPKAIKIRLENHPKKISIWMPKKCTRSYTPTSAWFWSEALQNNVWKEEQRLKQEEATLQGALSFNAIHVDNPTPRDIKKVEKIIDEDRMHRSDPNKYVHYGNFKRR